jgi:hypothetical protein
VAGQPLRHTGLLLGIEPHAQFGTTPDSIVQTAHPFVLNKVTQFGFVKLMAEMLAQVFN